MFRFFQILTLALIAVMPLACGTQVKKDAPPPAPKLKITDLVPADTNDIEGKFMKTLNFDIYVFEIPAKNIDQLEPVWDFLYKKPLRFVSPSAFNANSFAVGVGEGLIWDKVGDQLRAAKGKEVELASLLLFDGQANDLFVTNLKTKKTIFYISSQDTTEGVSLGPGNLTLRIRADKTPGARGVCDVSIQPAFPASNKSIIPKMKALQKTEDFLFAAASFKLKMSPGQFIFLGPQKYIDDQITLGSLFFSVPQKDPVVRTYLIVCKDIID